MAAGIDAGQIRQAQTERGTRVVIEVTRVERTDPYGTYVWGHRQYRNRRVGIRHTATPNLYYIPKGGKDE